MINKIFASSLASLFFAASMHVAEARADHAPAPRAHPAAASVLPRSGYLNFDERARPVAGQQAFCRRRPADCWHDMEPVRVHMTERLMRDLRAINIKVNRMIAPEEDKDQYRREDQWMYPDSGRGDCEDYQLLKQKMLRDAGIPQSAMRHAFVSAYGLGHDILIVRTDRGDFILDNLSDEIRTPGQAGYVFYSMLSPGSDYKWLQASDRHMKDFYSMQRKDHDAVVVVSAATLAKIEARLGG